MSFFNYNQNIPAANNNPSDDQGLMFVNTNSLFNWAAKDHHGFEDNLGGYHSIIHQDAGTRTVVPPGYIISNEPAPIPGPPQIGQLFTMLYQPDDGSGVSDTQLFYLTANSIANSGLSQLTGNFSTQEGYQWIGGVLIQWGKVTVNFPLVSAAPTTNPVIFKNRSASLCIPFPNNLFSVTCTPIYNVAAHPATGGVGTVSVNSNPAGFGGTEFNYVVSATVTGFVGFYWMAIGN